MDDWCSKEGKQHMEILKVTPKGLFAVNICNPGGPERPLPFNTMEDARKRPVDEFASLAKAKSSEAGSTHQKDNMGS